MNKKYMLKILKQGFKNAWSSQMWHTDDGDMYITITISNERYDISEERAREMWLYFRDYKKSIKKDFKKLKRDIKNNLNNNSIPNKLLPMNEVVKYLNIDIDYLKKLDRKEE